LSPHVEEFFISPEKGKENAFCQTLDEGGLPSDFINWCSSGLMYLFYGKKYK
jgi:hypothetical protein